MAIKSILGSNFGGGYGGYGRFITFGRGSYGGYGFGRWTYDNWGMELLRKKKLK